LVSIDQVETGDDKNVKC